MKVVCIKNTYLDCELIPYLTIGKIYESRKSIWDYAVYIITDYGTESVEFKSNFMELHNYRRNKIKKFLYDNQRTNK